MEKIVEHTNGTHAYMKIRFDDNSVEEIDVYFKADGNHTYRVSAENPVAKERVIKAFNSLY